MTQKNKKYRIAFRLPENLYYEYLLLRRKEKTRSSTFFESQFTKNKIFYFYFEDFLTFSNLLNEYGKEINTLAYQTNIFLDIYIDKEKLDALLTTCSKKFLALEQKYSVFDLVTSKKYLNVSKLKQVEFYMTTLTFAQQRLLFKKIKRMEKNFKKSEFYTRILLEKNIFCFHLKNLASPGVAFSKIRNNLKQILQKIKTNTSTSNEIFLENHLKTIQDLYEDFQKLKMQIENFRENVRR